MQHLPQLKYKDIRKLNFAISIQKDHDYNGRDGGGIKQMKIMQCITKSGIANKFE